MSEDTPSQNRHGAPIPLAQRLFDDLFLLLAAGMIVPTLFYIVWGLISLLTVPGITR
jgi:hypothetical protein